MDNKNKFGKIVYDGELYDLDTMSPDKLKNLLKKIENEKKKIDKQIDNILEMEE